MDRLAWDTVAWIAEMPEHMIHLEILLSAKWTLVLDFAVICHV